MTSKQTLIHGTEPPSLPDLDELADEYVGLRDARMDLGRKENAKRDLLLAKMRECNLTYYEYGDKVVELKSSEKIKVRNAEFGERDNGEEEIDGLK